MAGSKTGQEAPHAVARKAAPAGLCLQVLCRNCVGAVECNEAAILPQTVKSQAKDQDQKIAGFASSYPLGRLPSQRLALVGQLYVLQLHAQLRHFIKQ